MMVTEKQFCDAGAAANGMRLYQPNNWRRYAVAVSIPLIDGISRYIAYSIMSLTMPAKDLSLYARIAT